MIDPYAKGRPLFSVVPLLISPLRIKFTPLTEYLDIFLPSSLSRFPATLFIPLSLLSFLIHFSWHQNSFSHPKTVTTALILRAGTRADGPVRLSTSYASYFCVNPHFPSMFQHTSKLAKSKYLPLVSFSPCLAPLPHSLPLSLKRPTIEERWSRVMYTSH